LRKARIPVQGRLKISTNAHVIMPYHKVLDKLRESKRAHRIGTTAAASGRAIRTR
jgi:adenylosuccinate synthase